LLHRHIGSIPLNLSRPDVGALRQALTLLADGRPVGIFPEGPLSVNGRLEAGLPGVGLLALRSGAPVVPAGIQGTFAALEGRRAWWPGRLPLGVRFGPPRQFAAAAAASHVRKSPSASWTTSPRSYAEENLGRAFRDRRRPRRGAVHRLARLRSSPLAAG